MHISAIHAHHRVKATHENQFLIEGMEQRAHTLCLREGFGPGRKEISLTSATTKKEETPRGMTLVEQGDEISHLLLRIDLARMGSKGGEADPHFLSSLLADDGDEGGEVCALLRKDGGKGETNGVTEFGKDFGVVVEGGGLLHQFLVLLGAETALALAMLVNMGDLEALQGEAVAKKLRAQHVVEVGYRRGVLATIRR